RETRPLACVQIAVDDVVRDDVVGPVQAAIERQHLSEVRSAAAGRFQPRALAAQASRLGSVAVSGRSWASFSASSATWLSYRVIHLAAPIGSAFSILIRSWICDSGISVIACAYAVSAAVALASITWFRFPS